METKPAEKQDVDVLKSIIHEVASDIHLGIKIGEGGITKEDLQHVPAVIERVKAILLLSQKIAEAKAEIGDIDGSEVGELLIAAWAELQAKA